jgi:hypothetical protein
MYVGVLIQANLPVNPQETPIEQDFADDMLISDNIEDDIGGDLGDLGDIFGVYTGSPKNHVDLGLGGSPTHHADHDRHGAGLGNGVVGRDPGDLLGAETEELSNHSLLQQPLAVGFYVSTAPTGPLPDWFWSACPQRENLCPVCLRVKILALLSFPPPPPHLSRPPDYSYNPGRLQRCGEKTIQVPKPLSGLPRGKNYRRV